MFVIRQNCMNWFTLIFSCVCLKMGNVKSNLLEGHLKICLTYREAPNYVPPLLWRWWTAAKVLSTAVTVVLPVQGSVRLGILPQPVGRQDSTSCPSTSCYSGPLCIALCGGVRGSQGQTERRKKGRDHLRDTLPLWSLPLLPSWP